MNRREFMRGALATTALCSIPSIFSPWGHGETTFTFGEGHAHGFKPGDRIVISYMKSSYESSDFGNATWSSSAGGTVSYDGSFVVTGIGNGEIMARRQK